MNDLYSKNPAQIILYGTAWCGDCRRARRIFTEMNIPFVDVDIDTDALAETFVKQVNRGNRSVPTIIFPDGSCLTEPDNLSLTSKLNQIKETA
jgi:mycoredoxin